MLSLKISLMLITSSAVTLLVTTAAKAETYPQYIEIVKQSSPCQCVSSTDPLSNLSADDALLNDDKIGDKAIARFGCDCAAHRRTIAQTLLNQINN
jgi:hypothetical protein